MTEEYNVIYSPVAVEDITAIYAYISFELKAPETATNQTNRIRQGIKELRLFPNRHAHVDWEPWSSMGMRKMPIDNYTVYYLTNAEKHTVTIVRIFYGGRNVEDIIIEKCCLL